MEYLSIKRIIAIGVVVVALIVGGLCSSSIFETNDAGYIQIKQAAVSGDMSCQLDPGMYFQNFGDIHTYKEASTFHFTSSHETGEKRDQSLPTQFNDGAKSKISGSVRVLLPNSDCKAW